MKPLSPLSRMTASMAGPVRPVNLIKTIRLLTAFSVAIPLGAPLTFGQEEPPQEALSTPEQAETPPQADPDRADVLYLEGYCHYVLKHFQNSLDAFRRSFAVNPVFDPRGIYQARYRPEGP